MQTIEEREAQKALGFACLLTRVQALERIWIDQIQLQRGWQNCLPLKYKWMAWQKWGTTVFVHYMQNIGRKMYALTFKL